MHATQAKCINKTEDRRNVHTKSAPVELDEWRGRQRFGAANHTQIVAALRRLVIIATTTALIIVIIVIRSALAALGVQARRTHGLVRHAAARVTAARVPVAPMRR